MRISGLFQLVLTDIWSPIRCRSLEYEKLELPGQGVPKPELGNEGNQNAHPFNWTTKSIAKIMGHVHPLKAAA
jgi:hypothetical protein